MKINYGELKESTLFTGIAEKDLKNLIECIDPKIRTIKSGAFVFRAGDNIRSVYFILTGSMHIVDEDFLGNNFIVETMRSGVLFGEAYVFSSLQNYLVSVTAAEDSVILEMNPSSLFETCTKGCQHHSTLVRNALHIVAEKIVLLTAKIGHITRRTIREKLLSYLTKCSQIEKNNSFYIPYSRQQLADYLCVDRSALSHELSRLKKQGLIHYHKNYFELLDEESNHKHNM